MNLVEELIDRIYEDVVGKKIIGIYPGRFQPPGPHHFKTYEWMTSKFGKDNVYISTSNEVDPINSPLNFNEKKEIWMKYGVPSNKIVQVKSPYRSDEIIKSLPIGTIVVFGFGEKDAERFNVGKKKDGSPSYLQSYEKNKSNLLDYTKHSYLIVIPHFSCKVNGVELSGTKIRSLLATDRSEKMFVDVFGWYDQKIHSNLIKKLRPSLTEGGGIFGDTSAVKKQNLDATIQTVLRDNGMLGVPYAKIGNVDKPLLGDIDIAIDTSDMLRFLRLPPTTTKDELFKSIESKLKGVKIAKGLNQFHLIGVAPNQRFINSTGQEENKPATVQVDVMLGNRKWREKYSSGAPESEYKAKFRNIFIAEMLSKIIEDEGISGMKRKYLISPAEGFFLQKFVIDAKGNRKEISREIQSEDMDFVAEFLFGKGKTFSDINTFEKVHKLFNSNSFRFPKFRNEILTAFKENMKTSQKSDPTIKHPVLNEGGKISIQRFSGANEMGDIDFLMFLQRIFPMVKNGKIDLSVSDKATVTEKLDASPCMWGYDDAGKFYMESANSGEITIDKAERFNNPFTVHFYEALKFLNSYQPFQNRALTVYRKFGAYKVTSEMFPVLTHKGDELGDIVFCSTKYNRSKLGNKGAFVCFSATSQKGEDSILEMLESSSDSEWKIYNIHTHGKLSKEGLIFDIAGIQSLITNPIKLGSAIDLLKSRKDSIEKDAIKKVITKVKSDLQSVLNDYAERINTFLSSDRNRKYPVEGVVLKVQLPDGDVFIKGTSRIFNQIAEKTWGTRKEAGSVEKVFDGNFLKNVLGLSTSHSATINKAVSAARSVNGSRNDEGTLNNIALSVYNQLRDSGVNVSSSEVKRKAIESINSAFSEFNATSNKWNEQKRQSGLDPDTVSKTDNQLSFLSNKLNSIKTEVINSKYTGTNFVIYLLRLFIDKKIKQSTDN